MNPSITSYCELLIKWQRHINLVGPKTIENLSERHIADSLQVLRHIPQGASVIDLGSGAGLPGVVLAIENPSLSVTCVDNDQKKIAFLVEVKSRLGLPNLIPLVSDWNALSQKYDVVVARAAGKLTNMLAVMDSCTRVGHGLGIFHKGQSWREEYVAAQETWRFSCTTEPSLTNSDSALLIIQNLEPKVVQPIDKPSIGQLNKESHEEIEGQRGSKTNE
ncbi:MAG: 16S rRNA (guanine(527)-N(7))-methyltransferase RsmG [Alphaproteobacteria bacterium]|nr:MAG: 16S rRNA (guanine(527)-N(7))-methyltransferase RsmG [Alphaproteobacteria bacterium]